MFKAVLFDMDGVLCNSEKLYYALMRKTMEEFGVNMTDEVIASFRGLTTPLTWERVIELYSPPATLEELIQREIDAVDKLYADNSIPAVPGAFELIRELRANGIKTALATANFRYRADMVIAQHSAQELFDSVVSCEDVEHSKPAPDIFLLAAERAGAEPQTCVVIEDALNGIKAARAAGMKSVLYHEYGREKMVESGAELVVGSMEELSFERLAALFG